MRRQLDPERCEVSRSSHAAWGSVWSDGRAHDEHVGTGHRSTTLAAMPASLNQASSSVSVMAGVAVVSIMGTPYPAGVTENEEHVSAGSCRRGNAYYRPMELKRYADAAPFEFGDFVVR
ncbi:MAG: hypothetical protein WBN24_13780, partial [Acidimicrobiia bacterium]